MPTSGTSGVFRLIDRCTPLTTGARAICAGRNPGRDLAGALGDAAADGVVESRSRPGQHPEQRQDQGGEAWGQPHHCQMAVRRFRLKDS